MELQSLLVTFFVLKLCIFKNTKMMYMVDTSFCKICVLIIGNQNYAELRPTNPNHIKIMLSLSGLAISYLIFSHICYIIEQQCSQNSVGFNKIGFCFSSSCFNVNFCIMKCFLLRFSQQQTEILFFII